MCAGEQTIALDLARNGRMVRAVVTPPPAAGSLAQQQNDFTSEGAPPPGPLATPVSVAADKAANAVSPAPTAVPDAQDDLPGGAEG